MRLANLIRMKDPCTAYARSVIGGKTPAGDFAQWACARHLWDLDNASDYWFDVEEVNRFGRFAANLVQFEGEHAGNRLELLPWQSFVFGCIYGWKRKADDLRRFRTAYVEVPRKNGKTTAAVVPALYALMVEKEPAAEVYALATKQDQAKRCWDAAWKMIARTPGMSRRLRKRFNAIENESNFALFRPLGADSTTLDGLNPHLGICDEVHAWKDRALWDVIKDGMGSRRQPLMFAITTAGYNQLGICYELRTHGLNICDPTKSEYVDDSFFCYVAAPSRENEDAWDDPVTWAEANPSLGVTKRIDFMADLCTRAKMIPSERNTFLNKQLDIWTQASQAWLDLRQWDQCAGEFTLEDMAGETCFVGIDLAKVSDMSSAAYVFPPAGDRIHWRVIVSHYVPDDDIVERSKGTAPYHTWKDLGWITATPGNCTDYDFIRADINANAAIVDVKQVVFDRHFAHELVTHLQDDGFDCVGFGQGFVSMAAPTSELERMIVAHELEHNGDRVLRWQAGNVVVVSDPAGNIKPDKSKAADKIDGIVATIMALGVAMTSANKRSPYETQGIRSV